MAYEFNRKKAGLTRKLATAFTRAIDSHERGDADDLADQLAILRDLSDTHEGILWAVLEELEIDRFMRMFQSYLDAARSF